jgi:serine hydrolase
VKTNEVLFVHGSGEGGYKADQPLAASLQQHLGTDYNVRYPKMPQDDASPDFGWLRKIGDEIAAVPDEIFLVGHSLGASMLLKYLSENTAPLRVRGMFLLATPFWSGNEDWVKGLKLRDDFASALSRDVPIFLYQCEDDEEIDRAQLAIYEVALPWASVRRLPKGGHQFNNDLAFVARDLQKAARNLPRRPFA